MAQQRKRKHQDYVIGLISGRMVTRTDGEGKNIQIFQPFKRNPYPTLSELRKVKSHRTEDDILSFEKLRQLPIDIDRSVFAKSDAEKAELKKAKKEHKSTLVKAGVNPNLQLNLSSTMTLTSLRELRRA